MRARIGLGASFAVALLGGCASVAPIQHAADSPSFRETTGNRFKVALVLSGVAREVLSVPSMRRGALWMRTRLLSEASYIPRDPRE